MLRRASTALNLGIALGWAALSAAHGVLAHGWIAAAGHGGQAAALAGMAVALGTLAAPAVGIGALALLGIGACLLHARLTRTPAEQALRRFADSVGRGWRAAGRPSR